MQEYRSRHFAIEAETDYVEVGVDLALAWDPRVRDYDPPDWLHPNASGHTGIALALRRLP